VDLQIVITKRFSPRVSMVISVLGGFENEQPILDVIDPKFVETASKRPQAINEQGQGV